MSSTKVTKTYFLISQDDDLYKKGYFKNSDGTALENPTKNANSQNIEKNGEWYFRFPEQFLQSTNPRSIEVHHITIATNLNQQQQQAQKYMTGDIILHSDIVKRDPFLKHSVMICNQMRTKFKKYAYTSAEQIFKVWFTSFVEPTWKADYDQTKFIIEMMLIY